MMETFLLTVRQDLINQVTWTLMCVVQRSDERLLFVGVCCLCNRLVLLLGDVTVEALHAPAFSPFIIHVMWTLV